MYKSTRLGAGLAIAALLASCSSDRNSSQAESTTKTENPASATITVTATDFAFEGPATIAAGPTTVRLVNTGKELHQVQLIKIEQGKTLGDVAQALKQGGPPPEWIKFVGGPNGIAPGQGPKLRPCSLQGVMPTCASFPAPMA
jgi:plastocyanin